MITGWLWGGYGVVTGWLMDSCRWLRADYGVVMVMAYYGLYHLWLVNIIYSLYRLWLISPMNIFIFRLSWSLRSNWLYSRKSGTLSRVNSECPIYGGVKQALGANTLDCLGLTCLHSLPLWKDYFENIFQRQQLCVSVQWPCWPGKLIRRK